MDSAAMNSQAVELTIKALSDSLQDRYPDYCAAVREVCAELDETLFFVARSHDTLLIRSRGEKDYYSFVYIKPQINGIEIGLQTVTRQHEVHEVRTHAFIGRFESLHARLPPLMDELQSFCSR